MTAEVLTAKEAAEFLRVSENTVKAKARAGQLPGAKVGKEWRFRKADLDEWLARGGTRYEELVDEGLLAVSLERLEAIERGDDAVLSLEEVEARLAK
jgi:excisionase family DNA binding protein